VERSELVFMRGMSAGCLGERISKYFFTPMNNYMVLNYGQIFSIYIYNFFAIFILGLLTHVFANLIANPCRSFLKIFFNI
jgi:hypothetical protein